MGSCKRLNKLFVGFAVRKYWQHREIHLSKATCTNSLSLFPFSFSLPHLSYSNNKKKINSNKEHDATWLSLVSVCSRRLFFESLTMVSTYRYAHITFKYQTISLFLFTAQTFKHTSSILASFRDVTTNRNSYNSRITEFEINTSLYQAWR